MNNHQRIILFAALIICVAALIIGRFMYVPKGVTVAMNSVAAILVVVYWVTRRRER